MSEADFPENPFWDWSLEVYGRPGVAAACLALQERHGLDVNVLLFCCWAAARGQRFDRSDVEQVVEDVRAWHGEAVVPLRRIRQRLKGGIGTAPEDLAEAVRRRVATVELDAEHLEQIMLSRHIREPSSARGDFAETAAVSLAGYAAASGFRWAGDDRSALRTILTAAAPLDSGERVETALAAICGATAS